MNRFKKKKKTFQICSLCKNIFLHNLLLQFVQKLYILFTFSIYTLLNHSQSRKARSLSRFIQNVSRSIYKIFSFSFQALALCKILPWFMPIKNYAYLNYKKKFHLGPDFMNLREFAEELYTYRRFNYISVLTESNRFKVQVKGIYLNRSHAIH